MNKFQETFYAEVTTSFHFLEQSYGYQWLGGKLEDPEDVRDMAIEYRYVGTQVGVRVFWQPPNAMMNVYFVECLRTSMFPNDDQIAIFLPSAHPGVAKMIDLYSLAEVRGGQDDPDFLLHDPLPFKTWAKRGKMLEKNMPGVVAGLARATQTYASDILQGNTTIFPEIMKHAVGRLKSYYPHMVFPGDPGHSGEKESS